MKEEKQIKNYEQISDIFKPQTYSVENSLYKLESMGGILGLINNLKTCHRRGLCSNNNFDQELRIKQFGHNFASDGQNIFKKSLLQERDFIVNFLFYLLTLRICVKFLLYRDQILGLKPLGEEQFVLRIKAQIISYLLLICMVLLKAKVTVEYYKMDQDQRKYKNEKIVVRRDGEKQQIYQQDLMVGDIIIVQPNQIIRIDGIVVKSRNLVISQAHTILREDIKQKAQIWQFSNNYDKNKDPFILAGSFVIGGYGQILVCTVGQRCSFRVDTQNKGYYSQYTPSIAQLKKTMSFVQNIAKTVAILLATYISVAYLFNKYRDQNLKTSWMDLLHILKVYCGYIGLICFVQRLKVIKSLQFYIQANRSQKEYRIKNRAALEQLSKLDILFIESSTLAMRKIQVRDSIKIELDHINQISEINKFCQIKIISQESRSKIIQIFGRDIGYEYIFQPNQEVSYSTHVKSLIQATFFAQTSVSTFINDYLPIYKAMKYQIGYLYDSTNKANHEVPSDILQINFQKLVVNPLFNLQKIQDQTNQTIRSSLNNNFWIKIQNKLFMEDILFKLFMKSHVYSQLQNIYMTLYVNNVLVIAIFCYFSTTVSIINLSWYLLIIIANRYMFFTVYQRINQFRNLVNHKNYKQMKILSLFKLNAILFFYYFYVCNRMKLISSLFVFFFVNSILRIEAILYQKRPYSQRQFLQRIFNYFGIYAVVHALVILVQWNQQGLFFEEINNIQYAVGLFMIFVAYALFF